MILTADTQGERLDAFLARSMENMSRSAVQKLLEDGCVLRNGKPGKKNDKLNIGDEISVTVPEPKEVDITPAVNSANTAANSHCIPSKEEKAAPVFCTKVKWNTPSMAGTLPNKGIFCTVKYLVI